MLLARRIADKLASFGGFEYVFVFTDLVPGAVVGRIRGGAHKHTLLGYNQPLWGGVGSSGRLAARVTALGIDAVVGNRL